MCSLLVIILHHLKKTKYHWSLVRYHKWEILVYGECENIKQAIATTTTTTTTERDSAINYLVPTTVMFGHRRCPMIISTTCVCVCSSHDRRSGCKFRILIIIMIKSLTFDYSWMKQWKNAPKKQKTRRKKKEGSDVCCIHIKIVVHTQVPTYRNIESVVTGQNCQVHSQPQVLSPKLTLLIGLQSRFGDKPVKFQVKCS